LKAIPLGKSTPGDKVVVDHIDRDGLNNRRINLRRCTQAENSRNRKGSSLSRHGLKGVRLRTWDPAIAPYYAEIVYDGKRHHLGSYMTAEDAHRAYVEAAKRLHGEFARAE